MLLHVLYSILSIECHRIEVKVIENVESGPAQPLGILVLNLLVSGKTVETSCGILCKV